MVCNVYNTVSTRISIVAQSDNRIVVVCCINRGCGDAHNLLILLLFLYNMMLYMMVKHSEL